jgi:hypothetical protein
MLNISLKNKMMSRFDAKYKFKETLILIKDTKMYNKGVKCAYISLNHLSDSIQVEINGRFAILPIESVMSLQEYRSDIINSL